MKTTADLPLTEYQRGQLAHICSLARLETKEGSVDTIPPNDPTETDDEQQQQGATVPNRKRARCIEMPEACNILISAIQSFKEEVSKHRAPPMNAVAHRPAAAMQTEPRRRLPKQQVTTPAPKSPKHDIGTFTAADTHPPPVPPLPAPKPAAPHVLWHEPEPTVPLQLLAMTTYSQARAELENKKAELNALLEQFERVADNPEKLSSVRRDIERIDPELRKAVDRVAEAEAQLKSIATKFKK